VFLVGRSSRKEQRVGRSIGTVAMTKLKRPKAVNLDRFSRRGVKQSDSFEFAILQSKRMNATVSKVAPSEVIHDQ